MVWDWIIRGLIIVVAGIAANEAIKMLTGDSIPHHLLKWWNGIRETCLDWLQEQEEWVQDVARFFIVKVDNVVQNIGNKFNIVAMDVEDEDVIEVIKEETLTESQIQDLGLEEEEYVEIEV